jgi:alpha-galactosidase
MSLWAMLAAPLLAGNDLRNMSSEVHDILMNRDVIAIDQDKQGTPGKRFSQSADQEMWVRDFFEGTKAVAMFNRSDKGAEISLAFADLGFAGNPKKLKVRDLWSHRNVKVSAAKYSVIVPGYGVILLRVQN